jgi:hypothetical protein
MAQLERSPQAVHLSPTWPPLVDGYWQLRTGAISPWLKVQLRGMAPPLVWADAAAQAMGGRLLPLLRVASVAAWRLGGQDSEAVFSVQMRDEDPGRGCLRFDAPVEDPSVLLPDPYALGSEGYRLFREQLERQPLPPWRERLPRVFWRGASTGSQAITVQRLPANRRYQLCQHTRRFPQWLDARLTRIVQCRDVEAEQRVLEHLRERQLMAPACEPWYFGLHRFLIEIDGNVNSWGLLWKLLSGSCVLRVDSTRRQWYHPMLQPYHHIVPIAADLCDLPDRLAWCFDNPEACEMIAAQGRHFALEVVDDLGRSVLRALDEMGALR